MSIVKDKINNNISIINTKYDIFADAKQALLDTNNSIIILNICKNIILFINYGYIVVYFIFDYRHMIASAGRYLFYYNRWLLYRQPLLLASHFFRGHS